jgi:hypothetical protein
MDLNCPMCERLWAEYAAAFGETATRAAIKEAILAHERTAHADMPSKSKKFAADRDSGDGWL